MVSFYISGLWRKKNKTKIPTQIFGILRSVAEGKQTYFLGLIMPTNSDNGHGAIIVYNGIEANIVISYCS